MNKDKIRIVVIGASGHTGAELVRVLCGHPNAEIGFLVASSNAGKKLHEIYPQFLDFDLPTLIKLEEVEWGSLDIAFFCLPHATTQEVVPNIPDNVRIIDLSADFRIKDPIKYEEWYGKPHTAIDLQNRAVYGLTEIYRDDIKNARLIACPGCYPTSILLPLIPLLKEKIISPYNIIVDSKSGYSGAGAKADSLKVEVHESIKPYGVEGHRHIAEIEQELSLACGGDLTISFTPHVVPINRGMTSNINVQMAEGKTVKDISKALDNAYSGEEFVKLVEGEPPVPKDVVNTNNIEIAVYSDRVAGRCKIISAIDNLLKGASGQAVQNMNIIFGLDETTGLKEIAKL